MIGTYTLVSNAKPVQRPPDGAHMEADTICTIQRGLEVVQWDGRVLLDEHKEILGKDNEWVSYSVTDEGAHTSICVDDSLGLLRR